MREFDQRHGIPNAREGARHLGHLVQTLDRTGDGPFFGQLWRELAVLPKIKNGLKYKKLLQSHR
jgi:hypothetical protein